MSRLEPEIGAESFGIAIRMACADAAGPFKLPLQDQHMFPEGEGVLPVCLVQRYERPEEDAEQMIQLDDVGFGGGRRDRRLTMMEPTVASGTPPMSPAWAPSGQQTFHPNPTLSSSGMHPPTPLLPPKARSPAISPPPSKLRAPEIKNTPRVTESSTRFAFSFVASEDGVPPLNASTAAAAVAAAVAAAIITDAEVGDGDGDSDSDGEAPEASPHPYQQRVERKERLVRSLSDSTLDGGITAKTTAAEVATTILTKGKKRAQTPPPGLTRQGIRGKGLDPLERREKGFFPQSRSPLLSTETLEGIDTGEGDYSDGKGKDDRSASTRDIVAGDNHKFGKTEEMQRTESSGNMWEGSDSNDNIHYKLRRNGEGIRGAKTAAVQIPSPLPLKGGRVHLTGMSLPPEIPHRRPGQPGIDSPAQTQSRSSPLVGPSPRRRSPSASSARPPLKPMTGEDLRSGGSEGSGGGSGGGEVSSNDNESGAHGVKKMRKRLSLLDGMEQSSDLGAFFRQHEIQSTSQERGREVVSPRSSCTGKSHLSGTFNFSPRSIGTDTNATSGSGDEGDDDDEEEEGGRGAGVGLHVVVLHHGYGGSSMDMRLIKNYTRCLIICCRSTLRRL